MATTTEHEADQIERATHQASAGIIYPRLVQIAKRNEAVTEIVEMPGRGHSLTIGGWHEVADTALAFIKRFI